MGRLGNLLGVRLQGFGAGAPIRLNLCGEVDDGIGLQADARDAELFAFDEACYSGIRPPQT